MRKCKNEKRSHTEAHITERLTQIFIKCPKYLNKNPALFRHKSHMTAEIQANWENWKKKKNPNNLGYTENISKSPTPHSASDKVVRLIFIQPFYAINLIW